MPNQDNTQQLTDLIHQFAGLSKCLPQFTEVVFRKDYHSGEDAVFHSAYQMLVRNMHQLQQEISSTLKPPLEAGEYGMLKWLMDAADSSDDKDDLGLDVEVVMGNQEPHQCFFLLRTVNIAKGMKKRYKVTVQEEG